MPILSHVFHIKISRFSIPHLIAGDLLIIGLEGMQPACTWFLEIVTVFVWEVSICVCLPPRLVA